MSARPDLTQLMNEFAEMLRIRLDLGMYFFARSADVHMIGAFICNIETFEEFLKYVARISETLF